MKIGFVSALALAVFFAAAACAQQPPSGAPDRPFAGGPDKPPVGAPDRPFAGAPDKPPDKPPVGAPDRPSMDAPDRPQLPPQQPPVGAAPEFLQRRPQEGGQGEMMTENFFPPELVMQYQKALDLTEKQRDALKGEMRKMLERFTDLQWKQQAEAEAMKSLTNQERPDEKQVMAQLEKLLTAENEIKRLHMTLLVKVKNILTPEQQGKLRELKKQAGQRPMQGQMLQQGQPIRPQGMTPRPEQLYRPDGQAPLQQRPIRPQGQLPPQGQVAPQGRPGQQPEGARPMGAPESPGVRER
ncbi:MAG: Spy/CpxP family protein refolding chaperone [Candidatus Sumerlaeota bacterium]|nr:Spy/CpxP family protein refolding chaperone [Candidatus Sumerlaeota bacterium]